MGHLASAELQLHLQLVALVEELLGVADLGQVIVIVDVDPEFDLFDFARVGFFVFLLLGQFVAVFAEVHDAADRRIGVRRDFDEVEAQFLSFPQGVGQFHHAQLLAGRTIDHPHLAGTDTVVHPDRGWLRCA